jgi:hypothetical protein
MPRPPLALLLLVVLSVPSLSQEFDRLEGPVLASLLDRPEVSGREAISVTDMAALPVVFRESRATPVVVKTDQGNLARLLIVPGFRKAPGAEGEPVPTFVLERFETFAMPGARDRLARGRDLTLFAGFQVDLDSGQLVPEGQGGDLRMVIDEKEVPRLTVVGGSRIYTFTESPLPAATGTRPSSGRLVVPADFNGRYRLFANGQWTGALELTVTDGDVVGRFRSDQTGTSYPVAGQTGSPSHRIRFTVTLPRTKLDYDGHIFTDGKGAIAGTVTLLGRPFGFVAIREGGALTPEGEEADVVVSRATGRPGKLVLEGRDGAYKLDGRSLDAEGLNKALREAVQSDEAPWVLYRVRPTDNYASVRKTLQLVQDAGIDDARLEVAEDHR